MLYPTELRAQFVYSQYLFNISNSFEQTKNTTKYQKEAAIKSRKAVADFLINTFEITPL